MIRLIIDGKEADLLNNDFNWNMQCADFFSLTHGNSPARM